MSCKLRTDLRAVLELIGITEAFRNHAKLINYATEVKVVFVFFLDCL